MERRAFIKSSCGLCILAASGLVLGNLAGCSPAAYPVFKSAMTNKTIRVPLSLFATESLQIIRTKELYFDVAVHKKESGDYTALLLQCTHQDNALSPLGGGYQCSLHGSEFDQSGNVKKGPAENPLKQYRTTIEDNFLVIHT